VRFVFISSMCGYPWGGSEELWSQAALRLQSSGHKVAASVVWWPQLSPKVMALAGKGIELYSAKPLGRLPLAVRAWKKIPSWLGQTPKEFGWLRRQKPDLVVISQGRNDDGLAWMDFCRGAGLSYAAVVQANFEQWWPGDTLRGEMAVAYGSAKQVYCVSRHNLELLEQQIGESLPHAKVVWNPFNVPDAIPPEWPNANGVWKLACVARLEPAAKGQDLLLRVLAQPRWRERAVELNLYGAGPWEQGLKRLAGYLQTNNVHFRGHVAKVRKIWEENHLLALPSRYEGLPLALVEAMLCARAAIVTDAGGNAEVCVDGETGFVATAPAVRLIGETLERAWNHRDQWQIMGQAARRRAEQLIPKDPVSDFCSSLVECAEKPKN
jgi:glycosyltransferase involved in cell wall biosynthesis